jgi:hypothetical protein
MLLHQPLARAAVSLLRNVAAIGCLGFERHGRDPSVREGAAFLRRPAPDANRPDPCKKVSDDLTDQPQTLRELGISKQQSSDWQRLAAVPEEQFEAAGGSIPLYF